MFVRELHELITLHQDSYDARDALGRALKVPLHHGRWKTQPNHVVLGDDTIVQYTQPEHVQAEMERLVTLFEQTADAHPLVRAAWLHHSFICIHPFEDGNGRVARALVLLVLLRANYAPLVVERTRRDEYLNALDAANEGDVAPLIRLFAGLESWRFARSLRFLRARSKSGKRLSRLHATSLRGFAGLSSDLMPRAWRLSRESQRTFKVASSSSSMLKRRSFAPRSRRSIRKHSLL